MITLNPRSALTSEKKLGTSRVKKGKKKEKKKKSHLLALKTMKYKEGNNFFKITYIVPFPFLEQHSARALQKQIIK